METKPNRFFALLSIAGLAMGLAGCTGDSEPAASAPPAASTAPATTAPAVETFTPGEFYTLNADGVTGRIAFHVPPEGGAGDVLTAAHNVGEVTGDGGLDGFALVLVEVDNRDGAESFNVVSAAGYTAEGVEYVFRPLDMTAGDYWMDTEAAGDDNDAAYWALEDLDAAAGTLSHEVAVGEKAGVWLISNAEDVPEEFARLTINGGPEYDQGAAAE